MTERGLSHRTLFHGPFGAGQAERARDAVCAAADRGARDILYIAAGKTAALTARSEIAHRQRAVFGLRVVSLRGLPREIERRARVKGMQIAEGAVDDLLVERALRSAAVAATSSVVSTGLASAASRAIKEIERGGGTLMSFEAALLATREQGDAATVLLETWRELERLRGPGVRSAIEAQRAATDLLKSSGSMLLRNCSLIVLENPALSGSSDRNLIEALLNGADCQIVATSEYASRLEFSAGVGAFSFLRSMTEWDERPLERAVDPLAGAAERIFAPPVVHSMSRKPSLRIIKLEAAGEAAEVRLAARVVKRHLRTSTDSDPVNASDIQIIARGHRYRALIQEIFTQVGIGVNSGTHLSVSGSSLGSVLLDLLRMAADSNWGTRDQALKILRSLHLDVGMHSADRLAQRVQTLGYLGVDGWDKRALRKLSRRTRRRVLRFRNALTVARDSFTAAQSNDEMALAVRRLARELRLVGNSYVARTRTNRTKLEDPFETRVMNAAIRDDNLAWETIEHVLDGTMPAMLEADGTADSASGQSFARRWLVLFERALSAARLQRSSYGRDIVHVAGTAPGDAQLARVTIVLGLRQHAFPRQPRQDPFLRDALRAQLGQHGIALTPSEDTAEQEREAFLRAISTASDALYLSCAAADTEGKPAVPSFFIEDLQRAVGEHLPFGIERLGMADVVPHPEDAVSQSEILAAVAHGIWQRLPMNEASAAERSTSFASWNELLATSSSLIPLSSGRIVEDRPSFGEGVLQFAPHRTLELSASQLKTIQHCTYQHFVQKVLRPLNIESPEYDSLTKGTLVHEAMMRWVGLDGWSRGTSALPELNQWFRDRAARLPQSTRDGMLAQHLIAEDRERLDAFVRNELDLVHTADAARPTYNELAFGARIVGHGAHDPESVSSTFDINVETSIGPRTVKFTGSVDRVDTYEADQIRYGIALDYKTGKNSKFYSAAMQDGTDLQLRLYLLALEQLWGIKPVGALYVGLGDCVRRGAISEVAVTRIGAFDPTCITVMSTEDWDTFVHSDTQRLIQRLIDRLVTIDIVAQPDSSGCGFCDLGPICRYTPNGARLT